MLRLELYNGYRFYNRVLKVHFDKFEVHHQKCQEEEQDTFGLRNINDPASVELLRQTYATPYSSIYSSYNMLYAYNSQQWVPPPPPPRYFQESNMLSLSNSFSNLNINQGSAGLRDNDYSWYI